MKANWRGVLMFAVAVLCATTALVAAGLSEEAADQPSMSSPASRAGR
jgi:hypothetical protein